MPSGTSGTPLLLPKPRSEATAAGSARGRYAEEVEQVLAPMRVRQCRTAACGRRCRLRRGAPRRPVSRQISQESTVPSRTSSIGHAGRQMVQYPAHLGGGEHRVHAKAAAVVDQLPILVVEAVAAPGRRTSVLPPDHRSKWCAGARPPADDGLPLGRERDADDLGVGAPQCRRPLPRARSSRCALHPARPSQDAGRKSRPERCRHGPVGRPRR